MAGRTDIEQKFTKTISEKKIPDGFIKVTDNPVGGLTSEQKVILNRKANIMFNNGNVEDARRIYITTGYSDGLTRCGDFYVDRNEPLKALKQYYLAHNSRKSECLYEQLAKIISKVMED